MLGGTGTPLSKSEQAFFEPRFGRDFSQVKLHTDGKAGTVARGIHARAFTVGNDVVFGTGEYSPGTSEGRRLLAHELTHVVQQTQSCTQGSENASWPLRISSAVVQREEPKKELTPLEKLDEELNEIWPDDADIVALLGQMSSSEKQTVLDGYRDKLAAQLSDTTMFDALNQLAADCETRRDWLKAEGVSLGPKITEDGYVESLGECSLHQELKARVLNFCECLVARRLAGRAVTFKGACRERKKAHRWSTAWHILNGYVTLTDLQAYLASGSAEANAGDRHG